MSLDHLSDEPNAVPEDVKEYLEYLDGLIDTPELYGYAMETLEGIKVTIQKHAKVTANQRRAISNIVDGATEGMRTRERNRTSRRYEGYR